MNIITLKNFKSYQTQLITNLNPNINVIIGKNGQGKSNFFKSISFVLSDRIALNKNQLNNYAHKGNSNQVEQVQVQIIFKAKSDRNDEESRPVYHKIQRIWSQDLNEELKVNDRVMGKNQFQNFIESLGIAYSNPYNIIQQGKITQITLMDEYQIYKLLEETTGFRKYLKRYNEALEKIKKTGEDKVQIKLMIEDLDEKLKNVENKRGEFEYYFLGEKTKKARHKKTYENDLLNLREQLRNLKKKQNQNSEQIKNLKLRLRERSQNLQDIEAISKITQEKLMYYQSETNEQGFVKLEEDIPTQQKKELNKTLSVLKKQKNQLLSELSKKEKSISLQREEMRKYQQKYEALSADLEIQKSLEGNQKDKTKQLYLKEIQSQKQNITNLEKQLKQLSKLKSEIKIPNAEKQNEDMQELNKRLKSLGNNIKSNRINLIEQNRQKNQIQSQIQVCRNQKLLHYGKVKKCMPLLDFNLLNALRKQNISGVYGFMLEFLQIEQNVSFAYQIAGLSKLCTLLVEDQSVCSKVIQVNKQLHGRQINILPMTYLKRNPIQKKNYPNVEDCYSLLNQEWIKISNHTYGAEFNDGLVKLISNTFNKHVLVKDYELGLSISKEYHLNCITSEKEIVYSEGYLCKVGREESIEDRLEIYYKFDEKNKQEAKLAQQLKSLNKDLLASQNEEIDLIRQQRELEMKIRQVQLKLNDITAQRRMVERMTGEEEKLKQSKDKLTENIRKKEQQIANLQKKKAIKVNLQELRETQTKYTSLRNEVNKLMKQSFILEETLNKSAKDQNQILKKIEQVGQAQKQNKGSRLIPSSQIISQLRMQQVKIQEEKNRITEQAQKFDDKLKQIEEDGTQINAKICLLEQQQLKIIEKIKQIGEIDTSVEELEQLSNSFSLNRSAQQMKKKPHHFTARDKLLFSKFAVICENYNNHKAYFKRLEQAEAQLMQLISLYENENQTIMAEMFNTFQKQFTRIFQKIVEGGKADIRCKKIADKTRAGVKYKNCIAVKVSFNGQAEAPKKWNDFSGGQKTVIAICMLIALQKCEPAPFYIFDEIDSALDKHYVQKIMQLIVEECEFSQYFITSFKSDMLDFPEEICNYYLVESENRISNITRVTKQVAIEKIEEINN